MTAAAALVALMLGAQPSVPANPGVLPDDPVRALVRGRCQTCHSLDYLGQQRLTGQQWEKTIEKMRKFGAVVSDGDVAPMATYLARTYPADSPETRPAAVKAPRGALPGLGRPK